MRVNFPHFFILLHARCLSLHPSCYKGVDRLLPISFHLRGCHALVIALPLRKSTKATLCGQLIKKNLSYFPELEKVVKHRGKYLLSQILYQALKIKQNKTPHKTS